MFIFYRLYFSADNFYLLVLSVYLYLMENSCIAALKSVSFGGWHLLIAFSFEDWSKFLDSLQIKELWFYPTKSELCCEAFESMKILWIILSFSLTFNQPCQVQTTNHISSSVDSCSGIISVWESFAIYTLCVCSLGCTNKVSGRTWTVVYIIV